MRNSDNPASESEAMDGVGRVLEQAVPSELSRRRFLGQAGGLLAAGAAMSLPSGALAAADSSRGSITSVLATFEAFGVTLLSEAVKRAPGTPSAAFAPVLQAANTAEFEHLQALGRIGGKPLTTKFWIPDEAFAAGGAGLFAAIAAQEVIEISAYLVGVTTFTRRGDAFKARLCAEALGTEAEHRVLAKMAFGQLTGSKAAPNDRGFEAFEFHTGQAALNASSSKLGIGFGTQGKTPGQFYDFPGDPGKTGLGSANILPNAA